MTGPLQLLLLAVLCFDTVGGSWAVKFESMWLWGRVAGALSLSLCQTFVKKIHSSHQTGTGGMLCPLSPFFYYSETFLSCKLLQQKKCGPGWMFRLEFKNCC